jgi:4-amino-4-deoxy-L-arabinose transferase-like glycosyltransferase
MIGPMSPSPVSVPTPRAASRAWLWAVGIGLALRIAAILATPVFPTVANTWDSHFYQDTAVSLSRGHGFTFDGAPTALYPPAYPAVLSLAYRIAGAVPRTGQAVNVIASVVLLAAGAWLAGELAGRRAAGRTAIFLALDPSQIVTPAFLMSEVVCGAALLTALAALVRYVRRGGAAWLLLAAVIGAGAGMTRGHSFLVLPAAAAALWGWRRFGARRLAGVLAVLLVFDLAAVGLWAARNERVLGSPVLIATNGAMNLLLGNNPNARGGRADPPGGVPETGNEIENQRIYLHRALDYIGDHPVRFVALMPVKAARILLPAPAVSYRFELAAKWGRIPAILALLLVQAAQVLAWVLALRAGWREWWRRRSAPERTGSLRVSAAGIGIWTLGHLPFLGGARYFFPVEPLLWTAGAAEPLPGSADRPSEASERR